MWLAHGHLIEQIACISSVIFSGRHRRDDGRRHKPVIHRAA
jgi:hypothetical protein